MKHTRLTCKIIYLGGKTRPEPVFPYYIEDVHFDIIGRYIREKQVGK